MALTQLPADVLVTSDRNLARAASALVETATPAALRSPEPGDKTSAELAAIRKGAEG